MRQLALPILSPLKSFEENMMKGVIFGRLELSHTFYSVGTRPSAVAEVRNP